MGGTIDKRLIIGLSAPNNRLKSYQNKNYNK